jgi:hypothetical protein
MNNLENYDLVFHNKELIFGIYVGEISMPSFFGSVSLACVYKLPNSVQTVNEFNEFVNEIKTGQMQTLMYFVYWQPKFIVKAKECSKKEHLILKVKHSGR